MTVKPRSPDEYIESLPEARRRKNYISVYLNSVYADRATERWFRERYAATGKKLNMGKSCVRFRRLEDMPLEVIGETIARADLDQFTEHNHAVRGSSRRSRGTAGR